MWNRVACYCGVVAGNLRRRTLGRACLLRFVVPSGKLPSLPSGTGPKLSVCQCVCVCVCRCPCCSPTRTPPASSAVRSADRPFCFAGPAPFTHRLQSRDTRPVPGERLHPPSVCAVQCSAVAEELNKHSAVGFSLSLFLQHSASLVTQAGKKRPARAACVHLLHPTRATRHSHAGALCRAAAGCPDLHLHGMPEAGEKGRRGKGKGQPGAGERDMGTVGQSATQRGNHTVT